MSIISEAKDDEFESGENRITEKLRSILNDAGVNREFLNKDEAFQLSLATDSDGLLIGRFRIASGYYLYRDKMSFTKIDGNVELNPYSLPRGQITKDEYFGDVEIFDTSLDISLPISLEGLQATEPATIALIARYQGCAKGGICYPPTEKTFSMSLSSESFKENQSGLSSLDKLRLEEPPIFTYLAAAFFAGLLLSFTPCVLPLIPILSSVIAGQGRQINHKRTGLLSIAYVAGTATAYAAIGAVAGATGEQLQAYFQNKWAIGTVSFVLALMALSLFGLFTVQMPTFLQTRLSVQGNKLTGGAVAMVFGLGVLSALVVGACVSPILISILSIAVLNGNPLLGGALMFSVAIGMGVILVGVGFGASYFLPKAGAWMTSVQRIFGLMLLAVSIYLLSAIPYVPVLLLWALLFIGSAVYFGWHSFSASARYVKILSTVIATVFVTWGFLAFLGGLDGKSNVLDAIYIVWKQKNVTSSISATQNDSLRFIKITTLDQLNQHLTDAQSKSRPVLVDYYADWCTDCIRLENTTFRDAEVTIALQDFLLLKVDVTDPKWVGGRQLKKRYNIFGPPAILFFDQDGIESETRRLFGYQSPKDLLFSIKQLQ